MSGALQPLGRALIIIGIVLVGVGVALLVAPRVPWLGRLPGDILIRRDRMTVYVPITTSLLVSLLLSLIFWLMGRWR